MHEYVNGKRASFAKNILFHWIWKVLLKCSICFSVLLRWYAFPNFCMQISRSLAYDVRISSKASATAARSHYLLCDVLGILGKKCQANGGGQWYEPGAFQDTETLINPRFWDQNKLYARGKVSNIIACFQNSETNHLPKSPSGRDCFSPHLWATWSIPLIFFTKVPVPNDETLTKCISIHLWLPKKFSTGACPKIPIPYVVPVRYHHNAIVEAPAACLCYTWMKFEVVCLSRLTILSSCGNSILLQWLLTFVDKCSKSRQRKPHGCLEWCGQVQESAPGKRYR